MVLLGVTLAYLCALPVSVTRIKMRLFILVITDKPQHAIPNYRGPSR
jgi:hypothetical protein